MVTCDSCGQEVPEGAFCIRCGMSLEEEVARARAPRKFSAAPGESVYRPNIVSSLFPQLPRAELRTFQTALLLGAAVVVLLAVLKLFPLAIVASAVLTPLLTVIYLYDVDVYEDEPISIIGFTMLWGVLAGVAIGLLARALEPSGVSFLSETTGSTALVRGVLIPALSVAAMMLGPLLFLLRRARFNDVLDGATFGAASAVCFAGALVITQSAPFLANAGLRPPGAVTPWVIRLLELAILAPILAAAAVGAATAAWWLQYRSPVRDRHALGALGRPPIATLTAVVMLVIASLGQLLLPDWAALILYAVLAAAALVWLRRVLHLGLLQESLEISVGADIACANCGKTTPRHSFCLHCGISLLALPKSRRPGPGAGERGDIP